MDVLSRFGRDWHELTHKIDVNATYRANPERLVPLEEIAEIFTISTRSVWRLIELKRFPVYKDQGKTRVRLKHLDTYINAFTIPEKKEKK